MDAEQLFIPDISYAQVVAVMVELEPIQRIGADHSYHVDIAKEQEKYTVINHKFSKTVLVICII